MATTIAGLPFWELTFDADGDTDAARRDAFLAEVRDAGITDLVVFSHGWNNDHRHRELRCTSGSSGCWPASCRRPRRDSVGLVGVFWPSQRWSDEPIPDFARGARGGAAAPRPPRRGRPRSPASRRWTRRRWPSCRSCSRPRPTAGRDGPAARLAADRRGADEVPRPAGRVLHPGRRGRRRRRGQPGRCCRRCSATTPARLFERYRDTLRCARRDLPRPAGPAGPAGRPGSATRCTASGKAPRRRCARRRTGR